MIEYMNYKFEMNERNSLFFRIFFSFFFKFYKKKDINIILCIQNFPSGLLESIPYVNVNSIPLFKEEICLPVDWI